MRVEGGEVIGVEEEGEGILVRHLDSIWGEMREGGRWVSATDEKEDQWWWWWDAGCVF